MISTRCRSRQATFFITSNHFSFALLTLSPTLSQLLPSTTATTDHYRPLQTTITLATMPIPKIQFLNVLIYPHLATTPKNTKEAWKAEYGSLSSASHIATMNEKKPHITRCRSRNSTFLTKNDLSWIGIISILSSLIPSSTSTIEFRYNCNNGVSTDRCTEPTTDPKSLFRTKEHGSYVDG